VTDSLISVNRAAVGLAREHARWDGVRVSVLLAIAAAAVTLPMSFLGNASGHDFQFHMASWLDVSGQWREGILYPRWAEWANFGFGEPRFIFYPPISWMTGAALGLVLPWRMVPGAFILIALMLGGFGMWRVAREWLTPPQACAAAVLFAVNPYQLIVVYYRSDFAELLAGAFFPFLVWRTLRVVRDGWSAVSSLALVFALIWLTNAPAAVIATYSLALILAVAALRQRTGRPLIAGGTAMACGFGLAAFYILPAAWEQRWVQISQALVSLLEPKDNFLFTHANDPEFLFFNWKVSTIAVTMILIAAIAAVFLSRRSRELGVAWWVIVSLGTATVFLMLPVSAIFWRLLPKLAFVQFPWRWMGPLGFVSAFVMAAVPVRRATQAATWGALGVLTVVLAAAFVSDCWWDSEDIPVLSGGIRSGNGYEGTDEYQPVHSDRYALPGADIPYGDPPGPPAPLISTLDSDSGKMLATPLPKVRVTRWTADRRQFSYDAGDDPDTAGVRLLKYPAWRVTVDGNAAVTSGADETGQLLVQIPPGRHQVSVEFERTPDRTAGGGISILFALGLGGWWAAEQRRRRDDAKAASARASL
jgi:6-pyruvoyl-tetrahydropterin synthase related domain